MRINLIGCGCWGRNILRDLVALGAQVAVADISPEACRLAASLGSTLVVGDAARLPESDGIVIATPTSTHWNVAEQALSRKVPIFIEKPMTADASQALKLAEQASGLLFVMDKWRYHHGIEELRRIRESGELGPAMGMSLHHAGWGNPHADVDIVWILLPHCLSILLEVFGSLPAAKFAHAEQIGGNAVALNGCLGDSPWANFEVSARAPVKRREFRLHCEQGVAWLNEGWANHIQIVRNLSGGNNGDAPDAQTRMLAPELPLFRELRTFLEYLNGGPAPKSSAAEGALIVSRIAELRTLAGLP